MPEVTLRPTVDEDAMLLFELYASARVEELARTGWATPQQRSFFRLQAQNQEAYLARRHRHLDSQTVCIDGFAAGRILVNRDGAGFEVVDICLLPPYRRRGVGARIVRDLLDEARRERVPVFLDVPEDSNDIVICERLGFRERVDQGGRWRLMWRPAMLRSIPGPAPHVSR